MKIIFISCCSISIELENNSIYYSDLPYDVYLDDKKVLCGYNKNVFSLFDLVPSTKYEVKVNNEILKFKTKSVSKIIDVYPFDKNCNNKIQRIFDNAPRNSLINFYPGIYKVTNLFLHSDTTINLKDGVIFSGSTNIKDYKELKGEEIKGKRIIQRGTWEGEPWNMKLAMINVIDASNVNIVGQGVLNMNADKAKWFIDFRKKSYSRPHTIFINQSHNVYVEGIKLFNAAVWTIHPYFSDKIGFYDLYIENDPDSPNTDGINPQCVNDCEIIGVEFSVGDDCIAIKSGKLYIGKKYKKSSQNIVIRNCYMNRGHGAIVLGSEMSGGIKKLDLSKCLFDHTDRGLRIKTRRGRGKHAIINNVKFSNIKMKNVLSPFVINMFYFCDPDGKTEYVYSKKCLPVDEKTPYLGKFIFENIECINSEYCAGYFYGLPERHIKEIIFKNSYISFKKDASSGEPAMMSFAETCSKRGFVFNNVDKVILNNVKIEGYKGKLYSTINRKINIKIIN